MRLFRYASGQTDRHTYRHADHNTSHPAGDEVITDCRPGMKQCVKFQTVSKSVSNNRLSCRRQGPRDASAICRFSYEFRGI